MFLFIAVIVCTAQAPGPSLHGIVTTPDARPIAGVVVYASEQRECCANQSARTTTDDQGAFQIANPPKVIHFFKDGFAPASKVIRPGETETTVVLDDDAATQWMLPKCADKGRGRRIGLPYQLRVPRRTKVRKRFDSNNVSYVLADHTRKYSLVIWAGPVVGGFDADDDWLVNAASFTERSVKDGDQFAGQDFRGTDKAGLRWRWTGLSGFNVAHYRRASDEAARFFDRIIDSACVVNDEGMR